MELNRRIENTVNRLVNITAGYLPSAFASSLGAEDMVLLDLIARQAPRVEVFTLDTGRLPEETYELLERVRDKYAIPIRIYFPERDAVEAWVAVNGINAFYRSVAQRKQCCGIRKVEPLGRALAGKRSWLTGLRREQSPSRHQLQECEWDEVHCLWKFNPLLDWSTVEVWHYLKEHDVPYNALHDRGYPSIGCAPCTRSVAPGEDLRSGRWWWEESAKECGLHLREVGSGGTA
jgi:phosphoadenosine phosphosulfate reductase